MAELSYEDEVRSRVTLLGMLIAKGQERHNLEILRKGGIERYSDYSQGNYYVYARGPGLVGMESVIPPRSGLWGGNFWTWNLETLSEARSVFVSLCLLNKVSVWLVGPK